MLMTPRIAVREFFDRAYRNQNVVIYSLTGTFQNRKPHCWQVLFRPLITRRSIIAGHF